MTQAEAASPPSSSLDPAGFFAAPPSTPSDLVAARRLLLRDAATTEKFEAAVRNAREAGDPRVAAAGSWVTGEYRKALELVSGEDEQARFVRASSLLELGRSSEACEALKGACTARDPLLAALCLHALLAAGRGDEAFKLLEKAALDPDDRAYFEARRLESEGDYLGACDLYEKILEASGDHLEARFRLALRADGLGDDETAFRQYEILISRRPIPIAALLNLGVLYEDYNRFEKACGCYGAVLRRDPTNARARLFFKDAHASLDMYYDEDLERKEDKLMQVLRTPISEFELSVRARNCLTNMDIRTLGDLVSHSEPELLEFKNFGETSLNEIKRVLTEKGLRLGMRREDGSFLIPEEFDAEQVFDPEVQLAWLGHLTEEQREALDLPISSLNLSVRCHRVLVERLNLQKIGDILRYTEEDLLSMPNFGITSLNELTGRLVEMNLRLRTGRGDEYAGETSPA